MTRYEINNGDDQPRRFGGEWINPGETKTVTMRAMDPALAAKWRRVGVRISEVADARPGATVAESGEVSTESEAAHVFDPPTRHTWESREDQEAVDITGWRDLGWQELRSLAARVSKHPIRSKVDAEAALEAEEAKRAGTGATDLGGV